MAPLCLIYLQDSPTGARWLAKEERESLVATLNAERRAREAIEKHSVWEALTNPRVLLLSGMYFTNVCLLNGILFFLPLILKGFGLSNTQTGFVAAIPSSFALVAVIWWGRRSDARGERYGHAAFANLLGGAALLVSVVIGDPTARVAAVTVAYAATLAFTAPFWSIPASFLSGAAAAGGIAAISSLGVLGGFVAPSIVGYLGGVTGSFNIGLGGVGCLAIGMGIAFYLVGRRVAAVAQGQTGVAMVE